MALNLQSKFTLDARRDELLSDSFTSMSLFGDRPLIALILPNWLDFSNSAVVPGRTHDPLVLTPFSSTVPSSFRLMALKISEMNPC